MKSILFGLLIVCVTGLPYTPCAATAKPRTTITKKGLDCWRFKHNPKSKERFTAESSYRLYKLREASGCTDKEIKDAILPKI